jgi:hypothetical protein
VWRLPWLWLPRLRLQRLPLWWLLGLWCLLRVLGHLPLLLSFGTA